MFNLSGSVLRWLSSADFVICSSPTAAFAVAMTGQVLTACAQPFLLYAPTKLANFWFGAKERAFCTMLASLGNPLGLAVAQLVSPYVVTDLSKFLRLVRPNGGRRLWVVQGGASYSVFVSVGKY